MMRRLFMMFLALPLAGCMGNSAVEQEAIGQAKKVASVTPLLCGDYKAFEISLGVMRNGSGSISKDDMWFTVLDEQDMATLKKAVEAASIVKVKYVTPRFAPCSVEHWMNGIEILQ